MQQYHVKLLEDLLLSKRVYNESIKLIIILLLLEINS